MYRPHVVMDNSYGKVSATYETWTRPSTLVHWAHDWDEAQVLVGDILGRSNA